MGFTGDTSLSKLQAQLAELAEVPQRAAVRVADEVRDLIADEFKTETDPYGTAWKGHASSTIKKWGRHPVLDLTGKMKQSVRAKALPGAVVLVTVDRPAGFNQAERPILPTSNRLPMVWKVALDRAVTAEVVEASK